MTLHLLVTANSGGDLDYLPRLHTALQTHKKKLVGAVLLIDSGGAWSAAVEICRLTENRAPYLVMDAMGYDLIFADGLSPADLTRVQAQVAVRLTTDIRAIIKGEGYHLLLERHPNPAPVLNGENLRLPSPPKNAILHLSLTAERLEGFSLLPVEGQPDPTIAGTIEFVVSEARYYHKKLSS